MLVLLAEFKEIFGPFRLFESLTFRASMAGLTALFIGMIIAPAIINRLRAFKLAQAFRDAKEVGKLAELHQGKVGTPTMGGIIIFASITGSTLLWASLNVYVWVTLLVYCGLTIVGFLDDYMKVSKKNSAGLPGRWKLLGQALLTVASLAILLLHPDTADKVRELWIPFYKNCLWPFMPLWFLAPFLFVILAGTSNAINLTDGVDGLAIGCTITVALVYTIMAYATGNKIISDYLLISYLPGTGELAVVSAAMVGAGLAFLWFNSHPATVFMGDTGSLALGGLVGIMAFLIHQPFTLVIVGGIFVMEAGSVILQVGSYKLRGGKRIFKMSPIHHHFELSGWKETKVVIRFWILSVIFALIGLATLKLR